MGQFSVYQWYTMWYDFGMVEKIIFDNTKSIPKVYQKTYFGYDENVNKTFEIL